MKKAAGIIIATLVGVASVTAQIASDQKAANKLARLEGLKDAGFGIFIHWGIPGSRWSTLRSDIPVL